MERMRAQRRQIPMLSSTEAILNECCETEVDPSTRVGGDAELARGIEMVVAPESRVQALLTRREIEVLRLMAAGATNAVIARPPGDLRGHRQAPGQAHPAQAARV